MQPHIHTTLAIASDQNESINRQLNKKPAFEKNIALQPIVVTVGLLQQFVRLLMWVNIFLISFKKLGNPFKAVFQLNKLKQLRNQYRNGFVLKKFVRNGFRFYAGYNIPGWPSASFNRYVSRQLTRMNDSSNATLHTIIFGITKKCGFQCEHCYEWEHLNQAETLLKEDLVTIIQRFYQAGVSQVQLTGGEPLNRFKDLLFLLQESPSGIDYWLYTTGYSLTYEKARALKQTGLTGITISLDHHLAYNHDRFRGVQNAYNKALIAVTNARKAGLPVCFSLCATREFISQENLLAYAALAKRHGVSFIQVLEPRAVGHYSGKAVQLTAVHHSLLNEFYETINYNSAYADYPIVAYPGYYGRNIGCSGGGVDYLYVDMDGDVHNCPFCQQKLFSSLSGDLQKNIHQMKLNGCAAFSSSI